MVPSQEPVRRLAGSNLLKHLGGVLSTKLPRGSSKKMFADAKGARNAESYLVAMDVDRAATKLWSILMETHGRLAVADDRTMGQLRLLRAQLRASHSGRHRH